MSTRRERAREIKEARRAAELVRWEERKAAYAAQQALALTPEGREELARKAQERADFWLGVRIMGGVLAGVAVAHAINGAAAAPDGWKLAAWANANGVQL